MPVPAVCHDPEPDGQRVRRAGADCCHGRLPESVQVVAVGIPEGDTLVGTDSPRRRRVVYAPTNHDDGGDCYLETAEDVFETFPDTAFE